MLSGLGDLWWGLPRDLHLALDHLASQAQAPGSSGMALHLHFVCE